MVQEEEEWKGLEQNVGGRESLEGPAQEWFVRRNDDIGLGFGLSATSPSSSPSSSSEEYAVMGLGPPHALSCSEPEVDYE